MRLLIAYDGSTPADAAVVIAGRLFAGAHGRLLTVVEQTPGPAPVQAFAPMLDPELVRRELDGLAQDVMDEGRDIAARGLEIAETAGLALEPRVIPREGSESQTILSEADVTDADVIVGGSRGRGAVARSLLGSTSTRVLHHATRPVLVVPADQGANDGPALIAYDGSGGARAAIAVAQRLMPGRRAIVVHVWNSPMRNTLSGRALAGAPVSGLRELSADYEQFFADAAASLVEEGVALARDAGLDASGEAIESGSGAAGARSGCERPWRDGDRRGLARTRRPGLDDPRLGLVGPRPQRRDSGADRPARGLSDMSDRRAIPRAQRRGVVSVAHAARGCLDRPGAEPSEATIDNWWRQGMMGGANAHYDGIVAFSQTDFTEDLKRISVPVLVMHGDDHQIVPYKDSAPLSAELVQNGTLKTYEGFPHGMPTTQADTINADLLAFLQS